MKRKKLVCLLFLLPIIIHSSDTVITDLLQLAAEHNALLICTNAMLFGEAL